MESNLLLDKNSEIIVSCNTVSDIFFSNNSRFKILQKLSKPCFKRIGYTSFKILIDFLSWIMEIRNLTACI